jgi:Ca2+-binding RTX toxin-like protein
MAPRENIRATINGTTTRRPMPDRRVRFDRVDLTQDAQKSHRIPQRTAAAHQSLFDEISSRATFPQGERPFDWLDFRDNGQPLPSAATNAGERALYDASQHSGSHPVINRAVDQRLTAIRVRLTADLAQATTPAQVNAAYLAANARIRNVADAVGLASVGGLVDPDNVNRRLIYNMVDPNAAELWGDEWNNLDAEGRTLKLTDHADEMLNELVDADGNIRPERADLMRSARQMTYGNVGLIEPGDGPVIRATLTDMAANNVDVRRANSLAWLEDHKQRIAPTGSDLARRADSIINEAKIGRAIFAASERATRLLPGVDAVDIIGTGAAIINGDAHFAPTLDTSAHFGGGIGYIASVLTGTEEGGPLGVIQIPVRVSLDRAGNPLTGDARTTANREWVTSTYILPTGLSFGFEGPVSAQHPAGTYYIEDLTLPGRPRVQVYWRNPPGGGSDSPAAAAIVLRRTGPENDVLVVHDRKNNTARAFNDRDRSMERNFATAHDPAATPEAQQAARTALEQATTSVNIPVGPGNVVQETDVARASELVRSVSANGEVVPIAGTEGVSETEEITVTANVNGERRLIQGPLYQIRQVIAALKAGPGVLLDDIRSFGQRGQSLIGYEDIGSILGSQLSNALAIRDPFLRIGASTAIGTVLTNIGQSLDLVGTMGESGGRLGMSQAIDQAFKDFGSNLLQTGTGAVSSFIVGSVLGELGLAGDTLDAAVAFAGPVVGKIAFNTLTSAAWNSGLTPGFYATAASSFLGSKLADKVVSFDSVSGQIGASIGEAIGSIVAVKLFEASLMSFNPYAIAAAAVVVAVSKILGGLVGSLFGPSTSSATVSWDDEQQEFTVGRATSRRGGSKEGARAISSTVADALNAVVDASGAKVMGDVADQRFGMRNKSYVYWDAPSGYGANDRSKNFDDILKFGVKVGLDRVVNQLGGGDVFAKRALLNSLSAQSATTLNLEGLFADFLVARDYGAYLSNRGSLDSLIRQSPDSIFAAGWIASFARAHELGIDRRASTDWIGGWNLFLDEMNDGAVDGAAWSSGKVAMQFIESRNERRFGFTDADGVISDYIADTIDNMSKTEVVGTAGSDVVRISGDHLQAGTAQVRKPDGTLAAIDGPYKILVAATIYAGAGDDFVHAGDLGNDVLGGDGADRIYGGKLDDWLFGENGNDWIYAGDAAADGGAGTGLGGNGNYLHGGAGEDHLFGREGSDWLDGGAGKDVLDGGSGDDVLTGGAGDGDILKGGLGDDDYVLRSGDGADVADETAEVSVVGAPTPSATYGRDFIRARYAGIIAQVIKRNWRGDKADIAAAADANDAPLAAGTTRPVAVAAVAAGGEDSIVFGDGIDVGDVILARDEKVVNGVKVTTDDLRITIMAPGTDGAPAATSTSLLVKDWFVDPLKRIEWLKFADGNELRIGDTMTFITGTPGNDVIIGTNGNDFAYGDAGDDEIRLLRGNDIGNGGSGNDVVFGDEDRDYLIGGLGEDKLYGGTEADMLSGDAGDDELDGGSENDVLSGGRGNDRLVGGAGSDTFKFNRGDGRDTIAEDGDIPAASTDWQAIWNVTDGWMNGFEVDPGTGQVRNAEGERLFTSDYRWLAATHYDYETGTFYRFRGTGTPTTMTTAATAGSDRIEFGLGIDIQDVVFAMSGSDLRIGVTNENSVLGSFEEISDGITISNWAGNQRVGAMAFYQTGEIKIGGAAGAAILAGTAGADSLSGGAGLDWATGGAGDDTLKGHGGDDILVGGAGYDAVSGGADKDVLYGGAGDDVLEGGAGADTLIGGDGEDTASYSESAYGVRADLDDTEGNSGDAGGDELHEIENLTGSAHVDELAGDGGDNVLEGGKGGDLLRGRSGSDTYVWKRGDGDDVIADSVQEVLNAAGDINGSYIENWSATPRTNDYNGNGYQNDQPILVPNDGYSEYDWSLVLTDTAGNVVLQGLWTTNDGSEPPRDLAFASNGWQNGYARTGNGLQVARGAGDATSIDVLELGEGISFEHLGFAWEGHDLLVTVSVPGDAPATLRLHGQHPDSVLGTRIETLTLASGLSVPLSAVRIGTNGTAASDDLILGGSAGETLSGDAGNDTLAGGGGVNHLHGGAGDDTFVGGAGTDHFHGDTDIDAVRYDGSAAVRVDLQAGTAGVGGDAQGDTYAGIENVVGSAGNDVLIGDAANNELTGLDGENHLIGNGGDDVLVGGSARDTLEGGTGSDMLLGGAGDDDISGGDGNDVIKGGAGTDTLRGGAGNDEYVVELGDGRATVTDGAGQDVISFGETVGFDRLWLTKSVNDLSIRILGTADEVVVTGFFADPKTTSVTSVRAGGHSLFLNHADTSQLLARMAAVSGIPGAMPADIAADLARYWDKGIKAAPRTAGTGWTLSVNQDQAASYSGGFQVVDHDSQAEIRYSLSSDHAPANGTVQVDPATGAVTYRPAAGFHGTDSFSLSATDPDGQSVRLPFTVSVNGAPYNVADASGGTISVDEGASTVLGAAGGAARLVGLDREQQAITWSFATVNGVKQDAGGRFALAADGTITVTNPALVDYETAAQHEIVVRATDSAGAFSETRVTIRVNDVDDRPDAPGAGAGSGKVREQTGDFFARFTMTDQDSTPELVLADNPRGLFTVVGTDVRFAAAPDFEQLLATGQFTADDADNNGLREITINGSVRAKDRNGTSEGATGFTAIVEDVNEQPTAISLAGKAASIVERDRLPAGAGRDAVALGTVQIADGDAGTEKSGRYTYEVFENGAATVSDRFAVVGGELRLLANKSLDFETDGSSINLKVVAKDETGTPWTISDTFTFTIVDAIDVLDGDAGNNDPLTGQSGKDLIRGFEGVDRLIGGLGDDTLDGGTGDDAMIGGAGNDSYLVDSAGDTVTELASEGTDGVTTSLSTYVLPEHVENLTSTVAAGSTRFTLNGGANKVVTGDANDLVIALTGGQDVIETGAGNDAVLIGTSFHYLTHIDFGAGADQLVLQGSLAGSFGGVSIKNFESVAILSGLDTRYGATNTQLAHYDLTTVDATVAAGTTMIFDSAQTVAGETVRIDARAETDGSVLIYGGKGLDTFFGGSGNDTLGFRVQDGFGLQDRVDGGAGSDTLELRGNYSRTLAPDAIKSIEVISLMSGIGRGTPHTYAFTSHDLNVAAAERLIVTGQALGAGETLTFDGSAETDGSFYLVGGAAGDVLTGGARADSLWAYAGDDTLAGGAGADVLDGGEGSDTASYEKASAAITLDLAQTANNTGDSAGDTFVSIENILGTAFADTILGSNENNILAGGAGNDNLDARAGTDSAYGMDGDDTIRGGSGNDLINGGSGIDTVTFQVDGRWAVINLSSVAITANGVTVAAQSAQDSIGGIDTLVSIENATGSSLNDTIHGSAGDNLINGYFGADTMVGGLGNDTYVVDNVGDVVTENAAEGTDMVATNLAKYTLVANVENLYGYATTAQELIGNSLNNEITGGTGNDTLDGGAGNDIMKGGAGNDIYVVDAAADTVTEDAGAGMDEVRTTLADYTLAANVENLTGIGVAQTLRGNALNNIVRGSAYNDTIHLYAGGVDTLFAGEGNDIIHVGATLTAEDRLDGEGGTDTMVFQGNVALTLTTDFMKNFERISFLGGTNTVNGAPGTQLHAYNLVTTDAVVAAGLQMRVNGSGLVNGETLNFDGSAETDGSFYFFVGPAAETLKGSAGNDIFHFGATSWQSGDRFIGGNSLTPGFDDDQILLKGATNITFGADSLSGIESIIADPGFDQTIKMHDGNVAAGGKLKVNAGALGAANKISFDGSLEKDGGFDITGGAGTDTLIGGDGRDLLNGGAGNDTLKGMGGGDDLTGGLGNDTMVGGEGDDTYYVSRGDGDDLIQNFDLAGYDKLTLRAGITYKDIWFERLAGTTGPDDLKIYIMGANGIDGTVTVEDWFSTTSPELFRIELITEGTDRAVAGVDVEAAIAEMAKHTRPASSGALQTLLANNAPLNIAVEAAWAHLVAPKLDAVADVSGVEPLDNALGTVAIPVRAYYQDTTGRNIVIPATHIDVRVVATGGATLSDYVAAQSIGAPDANGNRTVTLTLTQNGSTHLRQNGSLPLQMRAQVRDVVDADGTRTAVDDFTLTIAPTADTATLAATGPATNAGTRTPLTITTNTPDKDGSERVDVLIGGIPSGYSIVNAAGAAVGTAVAGGVLVNATQLTGLYLFAPAGRFEDANLTLTPRSVDGGSVRDGTPVALTVVVNGAPTNASLNGSVNENAPNGTIVGNVVGVDPDGDALTYELLDNAGGRFALSAGGQLTVANGALLNHEVAASHNISVRVSDKGVAGQSPLTFTKTIAVAVNNVNEANALTGGQSWIVRENVAAGTHVGAISATDLDSPAHVFGQQRYYFLNAATGAVGAQSADGLFAIDGLTGAITVAGALSHEAVSTAQSYTVVARDNAGMSPFHEARGTVTIAVEDVNEANAMPASYAFTVSENVAVGTQVGAVAASDPDFASKAFGQQRYYFSNGGTASATSADGRYTIDAATGAIRTAAAINYETMSAPVDYAVVARDNAGASPYFQASTSVRIGVANVNETPGTPSGPATRYADEANAGGASPAQSGQLFASYALSDPDGTTPSLQFAAGGNPNNWFTISGNSVYFAANIDFEAVRASGYQIGDRNGDGRQEAFLGNVVVQASDGSLVSGTAATAAYLSDVNERPSALTLNSQNFYSESLPSDNGHQWMTIASFGASDPDGTAPTLSIVGGNGNGWFTVSGNNLTFANANFTTDWLRSTLGGYGQDAGWYHDRDGDGLKEVRVATLTLAAVDAGGLAGDTFTYNVLIEDTNEAPYWSSGAYSFALGENAASYAHVGTVAGADPDGSAGELRYGFAGAGVYYDGAIGYVTRSSDNRFLINNQNGHVYVNGAQALDYESGQTSFTYATVISDRSGGAHMKSAGSSLTINLQNVNEPHAVRGNAITVAENHTPAAYAPVPTLSGVNDARSQMLTDPENGAIRWQFSNGTTASGPWRIDAATGNIWQGDSVDYEAITRVETTQYHWNGYEYVEYPVYTTDPNLAVFNLEVQAIDDSTGQVASGNLQLTVSDVNEAVTVSPTAVYRSGGGAVIHNGGTNFYVKSDRNNGTIVYMNASDPEGRTLSYSLGAQTIRDINMSYGGNDEIDGGYPVLSIDSAGTISFTVYGDPDWEGGTKINSQRRTLSIEYKFDVNITDSAGMTTVVPYTLTFLRRNSTIPPIVLDLDLDGVELVSFHGSTVTFDMDSDGVRDTTGWVGADDGLLALDRDGNGTIDHINEISFVGDLTGATSDLEGLRAFDTDGSGSLDAGDARYSEFRVWRDANQDGISQAGELRSLAEAGVKAVSLSFERTGAEPVASDNVVYATAEWHDAEGKAHAVGDVFFAYDPSNLDTIAAPIVLDMDGDGSGLVSVRDSKARFDMDGDGTADRTGWIAKGDALLVLDRNGDGKVNDVAEISFTGDKPGAKTDLEGLAAFDTNGDRRFDARDARFGDFQLWFDRNGDGVSNPGELKTLAEAGIASIALEAKAAEEGGESSGSNLIFGRGAFTRTDGGTGTLIDAGLAYLPGGGDSAVAFSGWDGNGAARTAAAPATTPAQAAASPAQAQASAAPAASAAEAKPADLPAAEAAIGTFRGERDRRPLVELRTNWSAAEESAETDPSQDDLRSAVAALRTGLDAQSIGGFDFGAAGTSAAAKRMDLPRMAAMAGDEGPEAGDLQLARIVQDMAGFGVRSGDGDWRREPQPHQQAVDYFA